jgi:hypothetical protein
MIESTIQEMKKKNENGKKKYLIFKKKIIKHLNKEMKIKINKKTIRNISNLLIQNLMTIMMILVNNQYQILQFHNNIIKMLRNKNHR